MSRSGPKTTPIHDSNTGPKTTPTNHGKCERAASPKKSKIFRTRLRAESTNFQNDILKIARRCKLTLKTVVCFNRGGGEGEREGEREGMGERGREREAEGEREGEGEAEGEGEREK